MTSIWILAFTCQYQCSAICRLSLFILHLNGFIWFVPCRPKLWPQIFNKLQSLCAISFFHNMQRLILNWMMQITHFFKNVTWLVCSTWSSVVNKINISMSTVGVDELVIISAPGMEGPSTYLLFRNAIRYTFINIISLVFTPVLLNVLIDIKKLFRWWLVETTTTAH